MSQQRPYKAICISRDIDDAKEYNIDELNQKLFEAINACDTLISNDSNLYQPYKEILSDTLLGMIDTHKSIRHLLRELESGSGVAADAIPLARMQVETLFTLVWLKQSVLNNTKTYRRDAWAKLFMRSLLHELECEQIPRMVDFYRGAGASLLKTWADSIGVTEHEIQEIRRFTEAGCIGEKPDILNDKVPTPNQVLNSLLPSDLKDVLERFYRVEYLYLCGFSHPGQLAGFARRALRLGPDSCGGSRRWQRYYETHVLDPSEHNSYLSMLCVLTLCCQGRTDQVELLAKVVESWNPYIDYTLSGKFAWEHWASKMLTQLGVTVLG